jgi:hypothetical protein
VSQNQNYLECFSRVKQVSLGFDTILISRRELTSRIQGCSSNSAADALFSGSLSKHKSRKSASFEEIPVKGS